RSKDQLARAIFSTFRPVESPIRTSFQLEESLHSWLPHLQYIRQHIVHYTVCAEDVKTQLGAELHLYQFCMVIKALCACKTYFANVCSSHHSGGRLDSGDPKQTPQHCFRNHLHW